MPTNRPTVPICVPAKVDTSQFSELGALFRAWLARWRARAELRRHIRMTADYEVCRFRGGPPVRSAVGAGFSPGKRSPITTGSRPTEK